MRYLLENRFSNELPSRQKYIRNCLQLWCTPPTPVLWFQQLTSIPDSALDILFIVGHNVSVSYYLRTQPIPEKTIVAITCGGTIDFSWLKSLNKTIYLPRQNNCGYADLIKGDLYGFDFDLTESEILLYTSRKKHNIFERLDLYFTKL